MNIGKSIRNIREENNMSQEDFGKLFYVTRQTVSNWENEKSYPDLKTIVDISDRFGVSLDRLLKEDKEMVENISENVKTAIKWNKLRRAAAIAGGAVIAAAVISAGVYGTVWGVRKNKLEDNFNSAVAELGFYENEEKVYQRLDNSEIKYLLPNQEMPSLTDFSLDFHAKYVYGCFESKGHSFILISIENETFHLECDSDNDNFDFFCADFDETGSLLNKNDLTAEQVKLIDENSETIKKVVPELIKIYDRAYL